MEEMKARAAAALGIPLAPAQSARHPEETVISHKDNLFLPGMLAAEDQSDDQSDTEGLEAPVSLSTDGTLEVLKSRVLAQLSKVSGRTNTWEAAGESTQENVQRTPREETTTESRCIQSAIQGATAMPVNDPDVRLKARIAAKMAGCRDSRPQREDPREPTMPRGFECEIWTEGEEAESKWEGCTKNPQHIKFIPASSFSLQHLPEEYRKPLFLKGIQAISSLTVRVRVLTKKGSLMRTGSGLVHPFLFSENSLNLEVPNNLVHQEHEDTGLQGALEAKYDRDENPKEQVKQYFNKFGLSKSGQGLAGRFERCIGSVAEVIRGFSWIDECDSDSDENVLFDSDTEGEEDYDEEQDVRKLFGAKPPHVNPINRLIQGNSLKISNPLKYLLLPPHKETSTCMHEDAYRALKGIEYRSKLWSKLTSLSSLFPGGSVGDAGGNGDRGKAANSNSGDDVDDDEDDDDLDEFDDFGHFMRYELNIEGDDYDDDEEEEEEDSNDDLDEEKDNDEDVFDDEYTVVNVDEEDDELKTFGVVMPCPCPACVKSGLPKTKGYYVNVLTARHVVRNNQEAKTTVVDLFKDADKEEGVEHLYGVDMHMHYPDGDLAMLMCVTHEFRIVRKLSECMLKMADRVERMKMKSVSPLAVICSHPHGHFKHITVGEWEKRWLYRRRDMGEIFWTRYAYNTPTCPGSSGAAVLLLGYKEGTLVLDSMFHPHHGFDNGLNESGRLLSFARDLDEVSAVVRKRALKEHKNVREETLKKLVERNKEEREKIKRVYAGMPRKLRQILTDDSD